MDDCNDKRKAESRSPGEEVAIVIAQMAVAHALQRAEDLMGDEVCLLKELRKEVDRELGTRG